MFASGRPLFPASVGVVLMILTFCGTIDKHVHREFVKIKTYRIAGRQCILLRKRIECLVSSNSLKKVNCDKCFTIVFHHKQHTFSIPLLRNLRIWENDKY